MNRISPLDMTIDTTDIRSVRRSLRSYAKAGLDLFAQRVVIYVVAASLAGAYYGWVIPAVFCTLVTLFETYDAFVFRNIVRRRKWTQADVRRSMRRIFIGTALSSLAIVYLTVSVSIAQGHDTGHFMPLFLLISASIFAAMNNHQFRTVLTVRLVIYVTAIIFIPTFSLWAEATPITSERWLNLFTVIFVLGFLFELARTFLSGYAESQRNLLKLEEQHKKAQAAYIAKNEFLATVSHELRTPLTSIKGGLDMVNSGKLGELPEKMQRPIEIAVRNTNRLANLVDDLLLLQRAESGKLTLDLKKVDFGRLAQDAVERFRPTAAETNVTLKVNAEENQFWVCCDANRIDQVIINLLSNAAKFSEINSDVLVKMEKVGDNIRVSVTDFGIGIPEGSSVKVFEEFGQVESSDTRRFGGTGLGLNISKRIIEAHDATIGYTSVLGEGSMFWIDLPQVAND